ncbi:MAG: helix-turn-helix transcriptional regulator [Lachnospiraceae bacterium]|nr:helix-turn-helix transcriptional regulator [Lachnospiraceae bacterium]
MIPIGETIKKLRKAKGMTQEELAETVNVSFQAVSKWENGGSPDIEMLPVLANTFGVTIVDRYEEGMKEVHESGAKLL